MPSIAGRPIRLEVTIDRVDRLIAYVRSRGKRISDSCQLACLRRDLQRLAKRISKAPEAATIEPGDLNELLDLVRANASLLRLSSLLLDSLGGGLEASWDQYLHHLGKGNPVRHTALTAADQSKDRDVQFEFICACLLKKSYQQVTMEEPDVRFSVFGEPWGMACKVIYGKPDSVINDVVEGRDQIERSGAKWGVVVIETTNLFDHQVMIEDGSGDQARLHDFDSPKALTAYLNKHADLLHEQLSSELRKTAIKNPQSAPGILFLVQTVAILRGEPAMTHSCTFHNFRGKDTELAVDVMAALNHDLSYHLFGPMEQPPA